MADLLQISNLIFLIGIIVLCNNQFYNIEQQDKIYYFKTNAKTQSKISLYFNKSQIIFNLYSWINIQTISKNNSIKNDSLFYQQLTQLQIIQPYVYVYKNSAKLNKTQSQGLRSTFKDNLTKLIQINTRQQAFKQLKSLISLHKTTINLRIWLSVLSQNRNRHAQSQISILSYIVQQYGKGLLDPLDKTPSIQKTVFRVTQLVIKFYFSDQNQNVSLALVKLWNDLYIYVVLQQQSNIKKKLLYDCLQALLNGGADRLSQITAQIVLDGLLQVSLNKQDFIYFKQIAKRTLVLFLKTNIIHSSVLTSLQTVIGYFNINNLIPLLDNIINKIISYLDLAPPNSKGYKIKAQICNSLALIGEQLDQNGVSVQDKVIKVLQNLATDKVWAVQATGRKAITIWKNKRQQWQQQYLAKHEQFYPSAHNFYVPQQKQQNTKPIQQNFRPKTMQNFRQNLQNKSQYKKKETVTQKISDPFANSKYLLKNTGIGGGNNVQSVQQYYQRQKPQQTYSKKMQQIKKSIYNPKDQDFTQFDQTVPYNQNLPKFQQNNKQITKNIEPQIKDNQTNIYQQQQQYLVLWQKIVQLFQNNKKQQSSKAILQMDDDIYFLRYMLKFGKGLLSQLTRPTAIKIIKKTLQINKTHFMEQLLLKFSTQTAKSSTTQLLTSQQVLKIQQNIKDCNKIKGLQKPSSKVLKIFTNSLQQ